MNRKKTYIRGCKRCYAISVIIKPSEKTATCPICDMEHEIEWTPKTHAIANGELK